MSSFIKSNGRKIAYEILEKSIAGEEITKIENLADPSIKTSNEKGEKK